MVPVDGRGDQQGAEGTQAGRKQKRHLFRTFMTLVLLFGLLAGGAFAAKKYLLHQSTWSAEMKPLADEVAARAWSGVQGGGRRHAAARRRLRHRALPRSTIDTHADSAPTWRALGLLNGELDLEAVGRQAVNDSPAFYDPATKTIFVSDDLQSYQHLYRFAAASGADRRRCSTSSSTGARGSRRRRRPRRLPFGPTIDGDALAVANALAANDAPDQLAPELLAFVQGHANTVVAVAVRGDHRRAGRRGDASDDLADAQRPRRAGSARAGHADQRCDARRIGRPATTIASPSGTQGMMFWYYVLASRIDDGQAWSAAVRWAGDSMVTSMGSASQCVDAKVAAADRRRCGRLARGVPVVGGRRSRGVDDDRRADRGQSGGDPCLRSRRNGDGTHPGRRCRWRSAVQRWSVRWCRPRRARPGTGKVDAACLVTAARQRGTRADLAGRRCTRAGASTGSRPTSRPTSTWRPAASTACG